MNTSAIKNLLVELGLPTPMSINRAIEDYDRGPSGAEVEKQIQWSVEHSEPLHLARRHAPQKLQADTAQRVANAIDSATPELLDAKRTATLALFEEFRALGGDVPGNAEAALYAGPELQAKFFARQAQAARYGGLYRLHGLLLTGHRDPTKDVNPTAWMLFGDTRTDPPPSGNYRAPSVSFGPHDDKFAEALPIRLAFLASHSDFWQPDAKECTDHYLGWCGPKQPANGLSVEVVTS